MNPDPDHTNVILQNPGNAGKKGCGLKCCGLLVAVPILLVLAVYLVVFHSSLPIKWVAGTFEKGISPDNSSVELRGVGGSLSSGIKVEEVVIGGDGGDSVIEGLVIRYTGLIDSIRNRQLIIEEISTTRSDFVVGNDFFKDLSDEDEEAGEAGDDLTEDSPSGDSDGRDLSVFELRKLDLKNTRIRTADGETDIEIPLVHLAGLKIEADEFELADLEIVSAGLNLELVDAAPEEIEGVLVPFTRKVQGTVQPEFHSLVKSDIKFSVEFAAMNGETGSRVIIGGGALQQISLPGGSSIIQFKDLSIGDYMEAAEIIMPEHLTATIRESNKKVEIESGEFSLGETNFQIPKQQVDAEDPKSAILGSAEVGDYKIEAAIRPNAEQFWPPVGVELESTPKLEQSELLSLIYFQRVYGELTAGEKARIDMLVKTMEDPD